MNRKDVLEQLEQWGYETRILSNGINAMVKLDGHWQMIYDDLTEIPLEFSEDERVYRLMTQYKDTPIEDRGIIYKGSTYRIMDAIYDIKLLGFKISFHEQRIVVYLGDIWYIQLKPAERVWVKSQNLETLNTELRQELVDTVYQLLSTPVLLRFWEYTDEESDILRQYPDAEWVTRDPTTGGIELHTDKPFYHDNQFITSESVHLPYKPGLFLKINYSQKPYRIRV